jgi:type I restriction enzyme, S subunit
VVVVRSGNVGRACVIPDTLPEANCSDLVVIKRPLALDRLFLSFYLNSLAKVHVEEGKVGVALTHCNTESVAGIPICVPPLAEQKRIVARAEELMRLCDALEARLHQTRTLGAYLLDSTLHHLLVA